MKFIQTSVFLILLSLVASSMAEEKKQEPAGKEQAAKKVNKASKPEAPKNQDTANKKKIPFQCPQ